MRKDPVRIGVFGSGSMSSFRFLHEHDPNFGKLYMFVGAFSDVPGKEGVAYAKKAGIPTAELSFEAWRKANGVSRTDLKAREAYFAEVRQLIMPWSSEVIMLSGCMLLVTNPLLAEFQWRMLNVHPAFLSLLNDAGERKYRGTDVVSQAMKNGDLTGSTVHFVTGKPDMGPIVAESAALPYQLGDDPQEHQNRMKTACDGPAFQAAFARLIPYGWPRIPWRQLP
ncbi:hypothetical protein H7X87_00495 [Acetobacteraceae bacterium]|nr:hypothetical protein [Candidatus Parcubacteria bacterium]